MNVVFLTLAQQRINFEANCTFDNIYGTVSYIKIFKKKWLLHGGFSFGSFDYRWVYRDGNDVIKKKGLESPYYNLNQAPSNYLLTAYQSRSNGYALETGFGTFFPIKKRTSLRLSVTVKGYSVLEKLFGFYIREVYSTGTKYKTITEVHKAFSVGLDLYYTTRWNDFISMFYGVKLPYIFPIESETYRPQRSVDAMNGFAPHAIVGFNFAILHRKYWHFRRI